MIVDVRGGNSSDPSTNSQSQPAQATTEESNVTSSNHQRRQARANFMRWCPVLSSPSTSISVSGLTAKAQDSPAIAKANMMFDEGVHYWEVHCPIYCHNMQFGVSSNL